MDYDDFEGPDFSAVYHQSSVGPTNGSQEDSHHEYVPFPKETSQVSLLNHKKPITIHKSVLEAANQSTPQTKK